MLKVLSCFERRIVPAHHVVPHPEFQRGSVIIPVQPTPLEGDRLVAQVNSFGFTGSIATIIMESASLPSSSLEFTPRSCSLVSSDPGTSTQYYLLPFSGKSALALAAQMRAVSMWAVSSKASLADIALILGLCRDHHKHRRALLINTLAELVAACSDPIAVHNTPFLVTMQPDERLTVDILNLDNVPPRCFDSTFQEQDLNDLEKKGHILELARVLYERGHTLSFSAVYDKREVNATVLRGFPVYQFDRRRYWKDSIFDVGQGLVKIADLSPCNPHPTDKVSLRPHEPSSLTNGPSRVVSVCQETFESLIAHYGAPIDLPCALKNTALNICGSHILITGGNGMLGASLLSRLLQTPSITVYCPVRGDPWRRLVTSFKKHHLDIQLLERARSQGTLRLMRTADICERRLGLSDEDYNMLVESIDEVVHGAWNVNFNLPLTAFYPFLSCTRSLATLCVTATKIVRYHFVGSYASTFNYDRDLVPERVIEPRLSDSLAQVKFTYMFEFSFSY